jgi:hypothetical protein
VKAHATTTTLVKYITSLKEGLNLELIMRMTGGELTQVRWTHLDDQQVSLNEAERRTSILEEKWAGKI